MSGAQAGPFVLVPNEGPPQRAIGPFASLDDALRYGRALRGVSAYVALRLEKPDA